MLKRSQSLLFLLLRKQGKPVIYNDDMIYTVHIYTTVKMDPLMWNALK